MWIRSQCCMSYNQIAYFCSRNILFSYIGWPWFGCKNEIDLFNKLKTYRIKYLSKKLSHMRNYFIIYNTVIRKKPNKIKICMFRHFFQFPVTFRGRKEVSGNNQKLITPYSAILFTWRHFFYTIITVRWHLATKK